MFDAYQHLRRLRRTPRTRICDAPQSGVVKIVGRVTYRHRPIASPITGTRCAYYEASIDEWGGGVAHTLVCEVSDAPICIDDDSGHSAVEIADAKIALTSKQRVIFGLVREAPAAIERLLRQRGLTAVDETGLLKGITFRERLLVAGDRVAAWGRPQWATSKTALPTTRVGYRHPPSVLMVRSPRGAKALVSDDADALAA